MKLALLSFAPAWEDKAASRRLCGELVERAAVHRPDLVLLPEMTLTGFTMNVAAVAEPVNDSHSLRFFAQVARSCRAWLVAGLVLLDGDRPGNHLVCFDRAGRLVARYKKIHPFSIAGEDRFYRAGDSLVAAEIEGWRVGFSICYDLRFPEMFRPLARDCELLVNIANWPAERQEHWEVLLRARAIENQVFVAGVNRTGTDGNGVRYKETSHLVGPDGRWVQAEHAGPGFSVLAIELKEVTSFRRSFPILQDSRPELYRSFPQAQT